ncbi:MAG: 2-C-methyl-D-erythritol 4-phosphate cytidylyltransferase [Oscillospiraceae bacterium]|nr:2-C-methyl-D-erythritol 4-phosphate cytidylyltransferase [Oscillospiraceae bacterium]
MVTAIIMAGGKGTRSQQSVPKQFLTVNDTPVIVYTLRNLQRIKEISKIIVISPVGWEDFIVTYAQQFHITKLKGVVTGGESRNESIRNGLYYLKDDDTTKKVCLIDANRPLIPEAVIQEVISLADQCDCALTLEPCYDSMFISGDGKTVKSGTDRKVLFKGTTPECAYLESLLELYAEDAAVINTDLSTSELALFRGKRVLAAKGHIKCFKITTADDFELFKAFLRTETNPLAWNQDANNY